ncbi:hypothetical protein [Streptomyces sp. NBC_00620]|uniref:hypothetical protein n=1 Tax=Streptomyces sp. NBC_00620 TaxID=2903666 RepID=UPI00225B4F89|nr:hypothetical protein [Streptomyces sp. NBC_00620]MCX4976914.1 hypothetical protein [Streptomyces sp. NBC_00620]
MVVAQGRLDVVELKVTVSPEQARRAGIWDAVLGRGLDRRIWFCEQSDACPARLPLLDSGVILRLRETRARPDDTTVRLRPCRPSLLTADWAAPRDTGIDRLDFTSDWSGEGRMLSVSVNARHPAGTVARALAQGGPPEALFTDAQRSFLADCANGPVPLGHLTVLGPVEARWWPSVIWSHMPLAVERWVATSASGARLDVVELSRRVGRGGAEIAQLALESSLRRRGVDPADCEQGSKTRRVLELLTATP